ncbi:MAG TPA: O-antigen polymerase [Pyrinomonadaceae bacterium]|nr:O-antigen polymerase [Pyrinomonadaceae bacterium]
MAYRHDPYPRISAPRRTIGPLAAGAILWGLALAIIVTLFYLEVGFGDTSSKAYLVPWCLGTAAVILAPSIYLIYRGRFDPFHPLVFPAWSYFFPGFVVGGFVLASGLSQPYTLTLLQDERTDLPLTFFYVMLGFGGLSLGYALPLGRKAGAAIAKWLPVWGWRTNQMALPGLVLFVLGLANTILAFGLGILGFQKAEAIGSYDGLIFLLSLLWSQGSFLLWLYIFKSEKLAWSHYLIMAALISVSVARVAFQGNRGGIISMLILVGFAFALASRKITLKQNVIGGVIIAIALVVGMVYGTMFRSVKGSQDQVSITQMADTITQTADKLASSELTSNLSVGFAALAERIDSVSSLAVVVSNYEVLAPYEESYGMDHNIINELSTFFIPRVVWKDKPVSIEPSAYGDLYFNYAENSFTMTPMGDLLRNFGPFGVPIGMIILGFLIRIIYASLIEDQPFSYWRATLFFMVYTSISYEGTYGLIIPYLLKILVLAVVGLLLVRLIVGPGQRQPTNA